MGSDSALVEMTHQVGGIERPSLFLLFDFNLANDSDDKVISELRDTRRVRERREVRHDRVPDTGAMPKGLRAWARTVQLH